MVDDVEGDFFAIKLWYFKHDLKELIDFQTISMLLGNKKKFVATISCTGSIALAFHCQSYPFKLLLNCYKYPRNVKLNFFQTKKNCLSIMFRVGFFFID